MPACRWMKKVSTGYRGQRYQVNALRPPGGVAPGASTEPFVVGWTEQPDGGSLVKMVDRHPTWTAARVIDLGEDLWMREPGNLDR